MQGMRMKNGTLKSNKYDGKFLISSKKQAPSAKWYLTGITSLLPWYIRIYSQCQITRQSPASFPDRVTRPVRH
jgi:hypothetical protein